MIPSTLNEAIQELIKTLSVQDQIDLTRYKEDELSDYHHSLGQWIRNTWKLWEPHTPLHDHMTGLGFTHADDMSGSIIREFWARMNNKPSTLKEDVAKYQAFWDKELSRTLTSKPITGFVIGIQATQHKYKKD